MNRIFPRNALAAGLATLTLALPIMPASANMSGQAKVTVRINDLNLARQDGVDRLNRRIAYVAQQICGTYDNHDLRMADVVKQCRRDVVDNAAPQVELAVAAAKSGGSLATSSIALHANSH